MTDVAITPDLLAKIENLLDREAIRDCVNRYTRAIDRHDDDLLASVFHDDAVDIHGDNVNNLEDFVYWANNIVHSHLSAHMHHITSHTCEIDGDTAHAESYVIFVHRYKDGKTVHIAGGRYVDRLEKRDGEWRIALRKIAVDFRVLADGTVHGDWDGYVKGTQDRTDMSYERPLEIDPAHRAKLDERPWRRG